MKPRFGRDFFGERFRLTLGNQSESAGYLLDDVPGLSEGVLKIAIESPRSGARKSAEKIRRRRYGAMIARWAARAFLLTERRLRGIMNFRDLWV